MNFTYYQTKLKTNIKVSITVLFIHYWSTYRQLNNLCGVVLFYDSRWQCLTPLNVLTHAKFARLHSIDEEAVLLCRDLHRCWETIWKPEAAWAGWCTAISFLLFFIISYICRTRPYIINTTHYARALKSKTDSLFSLMVFHWWELFFVQHLQYIINYINIVILQSAEPSET